MDKMICLKRDKQCGVNVIIATLAISFSLSFLILGPKDFFLFFTGATILIIVFVKPLYGLSILAFSIPFAGVMQVGKQMTANKMFALFVLISFVIVTLAKKEKFEILSSNTIKVYIMFHIFLLMAFSFGHIYVESIQGFLSQFLLLGLVILTAAIPKDFQQFKMVCIATAAGSCSLGLYISIFGMGSLIGQYGTRLAAGTNENVLAHALGVGLLFSFFALSESSKFVKFTILMLDIFTIYAIFLTGSRGTWIGLILSAILFPLFAPRIPLKKRLSYFFMGSMVILTAFIGLKNNYFGEFGKLISMRISEHNSINQAAGGRLDNIWPFYINKFYEKPLFGWGAGYSNDIGMAAHNDFLNITVEFGIIGITIFLLFILYVLKDIFANKDATLRLQSLILFIFLIICGLTHNTISLKSYALAIGALCFLAKISNKNMTSSLNNTE